MLQSGHLTGGVEAARSSKKGGAVFLWVQLRHVSCRRSEEPPRLLQLRSRSAVEAPAFADVLLLAYDVVAPTLALLLQLRAASWRRDDRRSQPTGMLFGLAK